MTDKKAPALINWFIILLLLGIGYRVYMPETPRQELVALTCSSTLETGVNVRSMVIVRCRAQLEEAEDDPDEGTFITAADTLYPGGGPN